MTTRLGTPIPLPDGLRAEIKRLLVEALLADLKAYPNLAEVQSSPSAYGRDTHGI